MYRFTHQLFLTNHSVCLVLFDIRTPEAVTNEELNFWFRSIQHRAPNSASILVGTHCDCVDQKKAEQRCEGVFRVMSRKFSIAGWVAVDSISKINISVLSAKLLDLGTKQVFFCFALLLLKYLLNDHFFFSFSSSSKSHAFLKKHGPT